ncbi:hypothetical protein H8L32_00610 [Undibacterium sp. CY18W]|uniref:Uncharacterized protein n=1 Tax=Undibacterium hunanense TaxID=2762292 RepID=A0ABR6ZJB5_9BURK|nr:hypothetical protein [Undibacterium hunanense]MBC3915972.1 hypothetical protein [Undibacterium hunanense]
MTSEVDNENDNFIDGDVLQQLAPFLIVDNIQPGDVLLTCGSMSQSLAIARITDGQYSHASIWLPNDTGYPILVESDGLGVGSTILSAHTLCGPGQGDIELAYSIPNAPKKYKLLRHPDIASVSLECLQAARKRLEARAFHRSYSQLSRLIKPAKLHPTVETIAEGVVRFAERTLSSPNMHGVFCSELVVMYFEELNLPLFESQQKASMVSPNDLDRAPCILAEVENAFVDGSLLRFMRGSRPSMLAGFTRAEIMPQLTSGFRAAAEIDRALDEFNEFVRENWLKQADQLEKGYLAEMESYYQSIEIAIKTGDTAGVDKLLKLAVDASISMHLWRAINNYQEKVFAGQMSTQECEAWPPAMFKLSAIHRDMSSNTLHAHLRISFLRALRAIRTKRNNARTSWATQYRLKRSRKKILRDFVAHRKATAAALSLFPNEEETGLLSPLSISLMEKVIEEAERGALSYDIQSILILRTHIGGRTESVREGTAAGN